MSRNSFTSIWAIAVIILTSSMAGASAATFTVTNTNNSGSGSLRQAVLDSNAAAGSDTIVFNSSFNAPQTITLATVISINPATGDSLTITGPGANLLTVSGNNAVRIFAVSVGDTASISGMTLTQGRTVGAGSSGSAIDNDGNLTVTDSIFSLNTAGNGGAIANSLSLTVNGCTFTDNTANSGSATGLGGGAIYSNTAGTVSISNSTFTGNSEIGGSGGGGAIRNRGGTMNIATSSFTSNTAVDGGGAIRNSDTMTITASTFTGNATTAAISDGGAISNTGAGVLTIANSVITGNSTAHRGGGIYHQPNSTSGTFLSVADSTISNNIANSDSNTTGDGGGLYLGGGVTISGSTINGNRSKSAATGNSGGGGGIWTSAALNLLRSTVSGNTAERSGGAITAIGSGATILASTIFNNTAGATGGVILGNSSDLNLGNTIIANNLNGNGSSQDMSGLGHVNSQGYNLLGVTFDVTYSGDTATNITGVDPNLHPLQNNGGPTATHAPQGGSPVVDKGNSLGSTTDQRGGVRPFDLPGIANAAGGDGADIGAYEVQALALLGGVSRKVHGTAGTFDLELPLTGQPGVECRSSGGNHTLLIYSTNSVVSGTATVTSGVATIQGSPTYNGNTITVNLTGVADVQQITVTVNNLTDSFGQVLPSASIRMNLLAGDTNGNKSVSAADVSQTRAQSGVGVTAANFRQDVIPNGTISAGDISFVKSRAGQSVP